MAAAAPAPPARGGRQGSAAALIRESAGSWEGSSSENFLEEINSGTIFRPRPTSSSDGGTVDGTSEARPSGRADRDIQMIRDNLSDPSVSHNLERIRHTAREHVDSKMITCGELVAHIARTFPEGEPPRGDTSIPEDCPICLEQLVSERQAIKTKCGHWFHPLCLHKAFVRTSTATCPLCRAIMDKAYPEGADWEILLFVATMSNSAKAAQACHHAEMEELRTLCDMHERTGSYMSNNRWAVYANRKKLVKDIRETINRLQALQAFSSINVHGFSSICKNFDEHAGTTIAPHIMIRCVSEHAFCKDVGVNLASRTSGQSSRIPILISKMQALIEQTEGEGDSGATNSSNQGERRGGGMLSRIMSALSCRSERRDASASPTRQSDAMESTGRTTRGGTTTERIAVGRATERSAGDDATRRMPNFEMELRHGTLDTAERELPELPVPSSFVDGVHRETRRLSSMLDAVGLRE